MVENEGHRQRSLPPSELSRIDGICDRFEAAWEAGKEPRVEDYLGDTPEPLRSRMRRELTAIDRERRAKQATHSDLKRFVRLLVESGLMPQKQVEAFWASLPSERRPKDAQGLAAELIRAGKLTRYQADAVFHGRTKGLVLGEYLVLDRIGAGGMGEVLRARHQTMERMVALKVLPAQAMKSAESVERFHREVKAAARLSHPNIVTAHDAGEHEGIYYLVMEYVDALDLAEAVARRGPLPVDEAVDYTIQAARGLEYAHRQGVVHRDIKPGNLLVDREGTVKILDMGLARMAVEVGATGRVESLTQSGQVMGTCDYMAPEQAKDTHRADHRADIYSLGCTLYRLLTGKRPYPGETAVQILLAHCQSPLPSVREARPEVSEELEQVLWKMMAKEAEDRQQSMGEVVAELEAAICPEKPPVQVAPVPPPPPAAKKESSTERKLTAFLRSLSPEKATATDEAPSPHEETIQFEQEAETGTIVTGGVRLGEERPRSVAVRRKKRPVLLGVVMGGVGLAMLIGLLSFLARAPREEFRLKDDGQRRPVGARPGSVARDSYLLIKWPENERQDAKLEIDGQLQSLSGPGVETSRDEVKVRVDTGLHNIWIARRGYEPFEERVKVIWGETVRVEPKWRRAVEIAGPAEKPAFPEPSEVAKKPPPGKSETQPAKPEVTPTAKQPEQASAARRALIDEYRKAQQAYEESMKPVDERVAAWDFQGALATLQKAQLNDQSLAVRSPAWQEAFKHLAALKARIIAALNAADPPLRTTALLIPGAGGDVVGADEKGITVKRRGGTDSVAWNELGPKAPEQLVELVINPKNADDRLAAALLALTSGELTSAEEHFDAARAQGAETGPYLAELPRAAFDQALSFLEKEEFQQAADALAEIEKRHADTAWFSGNQEPFAAARSEAQAGIHEAEAEKLYQEAVKLFKDEQPFDVKSLVEQLRADYAASRCVTAADREPSFAELEQAVANLGQFITVRQDAKGDFTSIQAAIEAAAANSLIEVQDSGQYHEKVILNKQGLTVRGKRGCWPMITTGGPLPRATALVQTSARNTTLQQIVVGAASGIEHPIEVTQCRIRKVVIFGGAYPDVGRSSDVEDCILGPSRNTLRVGYGTKVRNSIFLDLGLSDSIDGCEVANCLLTSVANLQGGTNVERCTIANRVRIKSDDVTIDNCIIQEVQATRPATITFCTLYAHSAFIDNAKPGKGCFAADPMFVDPKNLDYRVMPNSPCRGRASDGGDMGVRWTPEMLQMCKFALELRAKGIIKF